MVEFLPEPVSDINIFTDGSKSKGGCGAGVAYPEIRIFNPFRLPNECIVFKCAIFANGKQLLKIRDEIL